MHDLRLFKGTQHLFAGAWLLANTKLDCVLLDDRFAELNCPKGLDFRYKGQFLTNMKHVKKGVRHSRKSIVLHEVIRVEAVIKN